jgi:tetratricopeptide (TPR) repeat protein
MNYAELRRALKAHGFEHLSAQLYSQNIISDTVSEEKDVDRILKVIELGIKNNPNNFFVFLELLNENPIFTDIHDRLWTSYTKLANPVHKMPPHLRKYNLTYTDDLEPDNHWCRNYSNQYRECVMDSDIEGSQCLTTMIMMKNELKPYFKAYCMTYHGMVLIHANEHRLATHYLDLALKENRKESDSNSILVQGRIHRVLAKLHRTLCQYDKAIQDIAMSSESFQQAAPSCEVGICHLEHAMILQNMDGKHVDRKQVKALIHEGQRNIETCKDIERRDHTIPMGNIDEALFHLHAFEEQFMVSIESDDLRNAKDLLREVNNSRHYNKIITSKKGGNVYAVRFIVAKAHACYYEENYGEATRLFEEARRIIKDNKLANERNFNIENKLQDANVALFNTC